ncbi:MAG: hypothetical protein PSX36_15800 [bacterium]|nr:hypothetical protein [bacterium]
MKQGYWKKKDDANKLVYEGEFKDDKPVGKFKYYYPNDSVRAIMQFKDGGKIAYAKLFHPSGKRMAEGKYINKEIKDSVWTYYDEAGVLISKDNFKAGKRSGKCFVYLPEGAISEERNYKEDLQEGIFKVYFDGVHLKSTGKFVNGKMEGRVAYFYPNGVEVAAGYYKNGQKNGPWIYKTESGKIRDKELYVNGSLASKKETDEFFLKSSTSNEKKEKTVSKEPAPKKTGKAPETSHE